MTEKAMRYQLGFSDMHRGAMYDSKQRTNKALKTIAVIRDYLTGIGEDPAGLSLLDIGCSTGYLTRMYGEHFGMVVGIDIDGPAVEFASENNATDHVAFHQRDSMNTGFADASFDAVTCTQVYEHVPDARRLMAEIHRVLKPGGFCYFAAGNRVKLVEAHYRLPLLSVVPKWLGHLYVRAMGKAGRYYETHFSYWGLRRLVEDFQIVDYTATVIRDPVKFAMTDLVPPGSLKQKISLLGLRAAYWCCPTYIWILQKPSQAATQGAAADYRYRDPVMPRTRRLVKRLIAAIPFGDTLSRAILALGFRDSPSYWEQRYASGRDSGSGSYGALAEFKGQFLDEFIRENGIRDVIDFGCGDGNQIGLFGVERYVGLDVSATAIELCRERYRDDPTKSFVQLDAKASFADLSIPRADMSLSLDVIYHLVEDDLFETYIANLFAAARSFVVIYASNVDARSESPHVRHRRFIDYISRNIKGWIPHQHHENPHKGTLSNSDFFVFKNATADCV